MRAFLLLFVLLTGPVLGQGPPLRPAVRQRLPALRVSVELPLGWVVGRPPQLATDPQLISSAAHPTWPAIQIGRGPEQSGDLSGYELNFKQRLRAEGVALSQRREGTVDGQPAVILTGTDGTRLEVITLVVLGRRLYYLMLLGVPPAEASQRIAPYQRMVDSLHAVDGP